MKKFLSVILSLSLVVSPVQANVCSATDVVAVQRNVTELINKLPAKLRVPVHKLLNGDPTWNATKLLLNETETRMLNEVLVEMHLAKRSYSLDGGVDHVNSAEQRRRDNSFVSVVRRCSDFIPYVSFVLFVIVFLVNYPAWGLLERVEYAMFALNRDLLKLERDFNTLTQQANGIGNDLV